MTLPLFLPTIGNTNWGTAVNNNWTWLNNAFSSSAAFTGTTNASSSIVGALTIGNGTATTSVGIGAGNINAGGTVTANGIVLGDATNIVFNTVTGTKIGTATSQKLSFYNATPRIQPAGDIVTALSSLGLIASPTISVPSVLDGTFVIENTSDTSKQFKWSLTGMTTGKVLTLAVVQTTSETLSIPNISAADTIATLALSQTYTGTPTFSAIVKCTSTTNATSSIVGAVVIGNGTAATSVGIGAGNINAGGMLTAAAVITGVDPGGSQILRVGGNAYLSGTIFSGSTATAITDYPTASINGYAGANIPGLVAFSSSAGGAPATSGGTQTASALLARFGMSSAIFDLGFRSNGNVWLQTGFVSALGTVFQLELNPVGGRVLISGATDDGTTALQVAGDIATSTNINLIGATSALTIGSATSTSPYLNINGATGTYRIIWYYTAGSERWAVYCDNTSESGSNAGSNYDINNYSDSGTYINTCFQIVRATGQVKIGSNTIPSSSFPGNILWGNQDGTTAALAGQVGELPLISNSAVSTYTNWPAANATYGQLTSINLTAGDWIIFCTATIYLNGATPFTTGSWSMALATVTASTTGAVEGQTIAYTNGVPAPYTTITIMTNKFISSSQTYYLNAEATYSAGLPKYVCSIFARRLR